MKKPANLVMYSPKFPSFNAFGLPRNARHEAAGALATDETIAMTLVPQEVPGRLLVEVLVPGNLGILTLLMAEIRLTS